MNPRRVTTAAGILALGAALTGCSDSGSSSSIAQQPAADSSAARPVHVDASGLSTNSAAMPGVDMAAAGAPAAAAAPPIAPMPASIRGDKAKSAKAAALAAAPAAAAPAAPAAAPARSALGIPDSALAGRSVIYNAEETIQVAEMAKAVSAVEAAVAAAGGLVARSERSGGTGGTPTPPPNGEPNAPATAPASANLELRIPPGGFNSFLDRVAKVGDVLDRTLSGNDVTDAVVDVASRVESARRSVDRVRALMEKATSLRDVVSLEGELSSRESDLEALQAKENKLKDQTDLATVTLHLETKPTPAPVKPPVVHEQGFLVGLDDGWGAFTGALGATATVAGAVLPFAVAIALLLPPLALVALRVRRARAGRPEVVA
jgi:uncharacterized protein DUF4349